jgi:hypothetical protein
MDASLTIQMTAMKDGTRRLKRMDADPILQTDLLTSALGNSRPAVPTPRDGRERRCAKRCARRAGLPCLWEERDLPSP